MANAGEGKCYQWLQDHLDYDGDYCLIWPFYRNPNGYGQLSYNGDDYWAHRLMCTLVNGQPPSPDHEAAHSCGNGDNGCAHPKHAIGRDSGGVTRRAHAMGVKSAYNGVPPPRAITPAAV